MTIARSRVSWSFLLAFSAASMGSAWAQLRAPDPVDPKTYTSPSKQWRLDVDPSDIYGGGPADYSLKNGAKVAWEKRQPFTLLHAEVTDDGIVAGWAYSGGLTSGDGSKIHMVILDARGDILLNVTEDRRESSVIDGGPEPWVSGLLLDRETDRVTFRVGAYNQNETWKSFRLSNGKALNERELKSPPAGNNDYVWLNGVKSVKGTPFNLVAWSHEPGGNDRVRADSEFELQDVAGNVAWQYEIPTDRAPRNTPGEDSELNLRSILPHDAGREFEIHALRKKERIRFRVTRDALSNPQVSEVERAAFEAPAKAAEPSRPIEPAIAASALPSISLGGDGGSEQANPTRGIQEFDIDAAGRFGFARRDSACVVTFLLVTGETSQAYELGSLAENVKECAGQTLVAWAGGSTWLVTQQYAKGGKKPIGWWVDVETRAHRPFAITEPLMASAIAGTGKGSVVLLAATEFFQQTIFWIASDNREKTEFRKAFEADRGELLSPQDLVVTRSGEVAVLDNIRHIIEIFDGTGAHKRSIDLEEKWGREPSYPSGISVDGEGGFFVDDFMAPHPFVHTDASGAILGEFQPRYEDGSATGRLFRTRVSPDGRIWGSDGEALLQLDARAVVLGSTGPSASVDRLGDIAAWAVDRDDRIYAVDRRSGAVHVLDMRGANLRTCAPPRGMIKDALRDPSVSVFPDGRVLVATNDESPFDDTQPFVEFSTACTPTVREFAARSVFWNTASASLWASGFRGLRLLDMNGKEIVELKRRADRRWLYLAYNIVPAGDGSLAVASGERTDDGDRSNRWALTVFAPDGKARSTTILPDAIEISTFAYDGRRIVAWDSGRLRVMDTAGTTLSLLDMPATVNKLEKLPILIRSKGQEAWILDGEKHVVHRFVLP